MGGESLSELGPEAAEEQATALARQLTELTGSAAEMAALKEGHGNGDGYRDGDRRSIVGIISAGKFEFKFIVLEAIGTWHVNIEL